MINAFEALASDLETRVSVAENMTEFWVNQVCAAKVRAWAASHPLIGFLAVDIVFYLAIRRLQKTVRRLQRRDHEATMTRIRSWED